MSIHSPAPFLPYISAVIDAFKAQGALQAADPYFTPRAHQIDFAAAVAQAIEARGKLVVEAGTGTGKTYAYLVPVLLSGQKAILSTATKGLQDQLFLRDLPHVCRTLGVPLRTALLKGRSNYLCLHRLALAQQISHILTTLEQRDLTRVLLWAQSTHSGDMAEMVGLDERSPILPWVTSTKDNCLGSECAYFRRCHLVLARKDAMAADVVVVNHHLFFADLSVRESGVAELLPTANVVVFDEAHQLNEAGLQFLGVVWSTSQVNDFTKDLLAAGVAFARGLSDWVQLCGDCEQSIRELRAVCAKLPMNARSLWEKDIPGHVNGQGWTLAISNVHQRLLDITKALEPVSESAPDLVRLYQRGLQLQQRLAGFNGPKEPQMIRWIEAGASLRLVESPLDIAQAMQERCFQGGQSWIFTSATLGDDVHLSWFTHQVGVTDAVIERFDSPFDYGKQAALYVPTQFPRPNDAMHLDAVCHLASQLVGLLGGRAFVLTTTLKALKLIGEALKNHFAQTGQSIQVLVQGSRPKRELLELFRQSAQHSVLVGSQSFWEGIDVAGDDLQLVIIDKIPFPPPYDPLIQARCQRAEFEGRNAFTEISIPEAAVTLKQGAGRLIRRETDRGVLVVCDSRLANMGYGKRLLAALPPMRRLRTMQEVEDCIIALKTNDAKSYSNSSQ